MSAFPVDSKILRAYSPSQLDDGVKVLCQYGADEGIFVGVVVECLLEWNERNRTRVLVDSPCLTITCMMCELLVLRMMVAQL
jgi:hypothetical protein